MIAECLSNPQTAQVLLAKHGMNLLDLVIIYFACGAPFGVYLVTTAHGQSFVRTASQTFLRIFCWPVFGILVVVDWLSKNPSSAESNFDRHVDGLITQIESIVCANESISSIFDFRDALHRYAGLSEAANVSPEANGVNELLELNNNENKKIASACLARKNQRRLSFHQSLARNEFVDMISEMAAAGRENTRIIGLAIELSNHVNDPETAGALTAMMSKTTFQANISVSASKPEISLAKTRTASSRR